MKYLKSIPGIGEIVASHLLARIGDPQQIGNVRQLAGFISLAPTEHSTGDRVVRGHITRSGDGRLRSKLIQAAWSAIRQDPELREFYRSVYQRHPRDRAARKAIVAVGQKAHYSDLRGPQTTKTVCGERNSPFGSFDPSGT